MNEEEIIEGNRLIAEFMGLSAVEAEEIASYASDDDLNYHTSWDWLMPVVEKANNIVENETGGNFINILWHGVVWGETTFDNAEYSKLGATWQAVVQFVKWYNFQKQ